MISSRRMHTKSRNGCKQCKEKRKRCNLVPPHCGNCQRLHLTCSYSTDFIPSLPQLPTPANPVPEQKFIFYNIQHASAPPKPTSALTPTSLTQTQQDKMLMHHFVTNTSRSTPDPSKCGIYTTILPQLAIQHSFILSTVLSFAARHLAYLSSQPTLKTYYQQLSLKHHNSFCLLFGTSLHNISSSNADAVLFAPIFAVFFQLWLLRESKDDAVEGIIGVFELCRKTSRMWQSSKEVNMMKGSLEYMLLAGGRRDDSAVVAPHLTRALSHFEHLLSVPGVVKDDENEMYIELLGSLRVLADVLVRFPDNFSPVARWMEGVPEAFLGRLRVGQEFAVCVLGVYCGIVMEAPRWWAISGWSERVLQAVIVRAMDYRINYFDWAEFQVMYCH